MVVLGLGNPGSEYSDTRHNCGFKVVEYLGAKTGIELQKKFFKKYIYGKGVFRGQELFLIKPLTFMNASGEVIREGCRLHHKRYYCGMRQYGSLSRGSAYKAWRR